MADIILDAAPQDPADWQVDDGLEPRDTGVREDVIEAAFAEIADGRDQVRRAFEALHQGLRIYDEKPDSMIRVCVDQRALRVANELAPYFTSFWENQSQKANNFSHRFINRRFNDQEASGAIEPEPKPEPTKPAAAPAETTPTEAVADDLDDVQAIPAAVIDSIAKNTEALPEETTATATATATAPAPTGTETSKTKRRAYIQNMRTKYDIKITKTHMLNELWTNEGTYARYRPLEVGLYYDLVNQSTIDDIFRIMLKHRFYASMLTVYTSLLNTPELCHLAMTPGVLTAMFDTLSYTSDGLDGLEFAHPFSDPKYLEPLHDGIFRAMYILYLEECLIGSAATWQHRYVLPLSTACRLPPYAGSLEQNPYVPVSLRPDVITGKAFVGPEYIVKPLQAPSALRGLYNLTSFQERFRIFTGGIFCGLNFDKLYFNGSALAACAIRNPLERMFGYEYPREIEGTSSAADNKAFWAKNEAKVARYFEEYYPSKACLTAMNTILAEGKLLEVEDILSDIDIVVDVLDDMEFDRYANQIFETIKRNLGGDAQVRLARISTAQSHKYYITGRDLPRSIEIFRFYYYQPVGGVSRYHLPVVRGTYTGSEVYLMPSMICAAYSGLQPDRRWMKSAASSKNVMLRYFTRGFPGLLNADEHRELTEHAKDSPAWAELVAMSNAENTISVNNPLFRPRLSGLDKHHELRPYGYSSDNAYKFITDHHETATHERSTYGFELNLRYPSGNIRPIHLWQILPYRDDLLRSQRYTADRLEV